MTRGGGWRPKRPADTHPTDWKGSALSVHAATAELAAEIVSTPCAVTAPAAGPHSAAATSAVACLTET